MDTCKPAGQPVKVEQITTVPGKFPDEWNEDIVRLMGKASSAPTANHSPANGLAVAYPRTVAKRTVAAKV